MVYTKADSLKSYSINILNTIEASEIYYFENLHIIQKETTNELLVFRWTPNNKEIPFNSKTFSGKLEVFDQNYQIVTSKSFANGTSDPIPDEYQMNCDILVDCNCPGGPWCGCDGSYANCFNSFNVVCSLYGGGGGGGSGSGGTGSGGGSGGGGSGSGSTPSEPAIEDTNNEILVVIPINPIDFDEVEDPCANLKNLFDPTKANIKPNILNDLQPNIAVNPSGEKGVLLSMSPKGVPTNIIIPSVPEPPLPITAGGNRYSAIHTHPLDTYPMFSWTDVLVLNTLNNNVAPHNQGLASFLLVCKDDNEVFQTYAIVFDPNSLNETIDQFMNNPENIACTVEEISNKENGKLKIEYDTEYDGPNPNYERVFLRSIFNTNVSLYKANSTLTNWSKLSLSNNTATAIVKKINCK